MRTLPNINGLAMRIIEAGNNSEKQPMLLLLHGFPELAYSWRKVMPALAAEGYYVVAPDQRGYGGTTGWSADYDADITPFRFLNLARDTLALLGALGRSHVDCLIGHDFGAPLSAWCALIRPDVYRRVVLMSAPFSGPPRFSDDIHDPVHDDMRVLPRPRKHYQWYYATRSANHDMIHPPGGLANFLRAYYHVKSADWPGNRPEPLAGWTADALANLPTYYVMDAGATMPETVAPHMPDAETVAACHWLTDAELAVYAAAYEKTGFQGGLNWYRNAISVEQKRELCLFAGSKITVPACFIAGRKDWGIYQVPGAVDRMAEHATTNFQGCRLIDGAGHWVQQEQPDAVVAGIMDFLRTTA